MTDLPFASTVSGASDLLSHYNYKDIVSMHALYRRDLEFSTNAKDTILVSPMSITTNVN